jgi:hypothetical protein
VGAAVEEKRHRSTQHDTGRGISALRRMLVVRARRGWIQGEKHKAGCATASACGMSARRYHSIGSMGSGGRV